MLTALALLAWGSLLPVLWNWRIALQGTTLTTAGTTACLAWMLWGIAGGLSLANCLGDGALAVVWYAVAVVMLVPPIAVLGARRPIHRAWPWFVLLPLVLIFAWPAASAFPRFQPPREWNIESPVLAGYALLLLMGAGNFLGLRHTIPSLLWMASLGLLAGSLCPATAARLPGPPDARHWATLLLSAAGWWGLWQSRRSQRQRKSGNTHPLDRVWFDFQDVFGVVWARRVQDRFNDLVRQRRVPVLLTMHGLRGGAAGETSISEVALVDLQGAEANLRWLLQKFVDPDWIDARLRPTQGA
ncbi:MAG: hypothetical protein ACKV0T_03205 [Planctomycetales bacterium]